MQMYHTLTAKPIASKIILVCKGRRAPSPGTVADIAAQRGRPEWSHAPRWPRVLFRTRQTDCLTDDADVNVWKSTAIAQLGDAESTTN